MNNDKIGNVSSKLVKELGNMCPAAASAKLAEVLDNLQTQINGGGGGNENSDGLVHETFPRINFATGALYSGVGNYDGPPTIPAEARPKAFPRPAHANWSDMPEPGDHADVTITGIDVKGNVVSRTFSITGDMTPGDMYTAGTIVCFTKVTNVKVENYASANNWAIRVYFMPIIGLAHYPVECEILCYNGGEFSNFYRIGDPVPPMGPYPRIIYDETYGRLMVHPGDMQPVYDPGENRFDCINVWYRKR
jgi:hypothetical protein